MAYNGSYGGFNDEYDRDWHDRNYTPQCGYNAFNKEHTPPYSPYETPHDWKQHNDTHDKARKRVYSTDERHPRPPPPHNSDGYQAIRRLGLLVSSAHSHIKTIVRYNARLQAPFGTPQNVASRGLLNLIVLLQSYIGEAELLLHEAPKKTPSSELQEPLDNLRGAAQLLNHVAEAVEKCRIIALEESMRTGVERAVTKGLGSCSELNTLKDQLKELKKFRNATNSEGTVVGWKALRWQYLKATE